MKRVQFTPTNTIDFRHFKINYKISFKILEAIHKEYKKVSNKQRSYQRYSHADDADIENSGSGESNQPHRKYSWYRKESDAEDGDSDVTVRPAGESEEFVSESDEQTEENERHSPMPHYSTPHQQSSARKNTGTLVTQIMRIIVQITQIARIIAQFTQISRIMAQIRQITKTTNPIVPT